MVGVTRLHMHEQTTVTAGKKKMSDKKNAELDREDMARDHACVNEYNKSASNCLQLQ